MLWYQIWFVSVAETWKQMTHKSDVQLLWTCLIDQFVCCRRSDWTWLIGWSCDIYNRPETEHFCPPHHFLCSLRKCLCVNVTSASSSVSLGPRSGLHCFSAAGRPLGCLFGNRWRPASVAARCNRRGESDVSEQDGLCFSQTVVWQNTRVHCSFLQFSYSTAAGTESRNMSAELLARSYLQVKVPRRAAACPLALYMKWRFLLRRFYIWSN